MIADRKDAVSPIEKRHNEAQARMLPMARIVAGAAPLADSLQRTPEWERYCTYLKGMADRFAAQKQVAQQKIGDPSIVDDAQVRKLRQDIFEADVWVRAMQFAIELPAAIIQGGDEADKFISSMEKKNEATSQAA